MHTAVAVQMHVHPRAAGWYPDPFGRYQYRWFDGDQWTEAVGHGGRQRSDPHGTGPGHVPRALADRGWVRRRVQAQVVRTGGVGRRPARAHGLLDADVLVVRQKAKLVELANEYMLYDEHGAQVGAVREVGQSTGRRALRALTGIDQYLGHHLEVTDTSGAAVLRLRCPARLLRSTVVVEGPTGEVVGRLVQRSVLGRPRFDLHGARGARLGVVQAQDFRKREFRVQDGEGRQVARVQRTSVGLARAVLTTADDYVVRVDHPLSDPLRSLVVAAALCIDTAVLQSRRWGPA